MTYHMCSSVQFHVENRRDYKAVVLKSLIRCCCCCCWRMDRGCQALWY